MPWDNHKRVTTGIIKNYLAILEVIVGYIPGHSPESGPGVPPPSVNDLK
jgi:hypothetical protein